MMRSPVRQLHVCGSQAPPLHDGDLLLGQAIQLIDQRVDVRVYAPLPTWASFLCKSGTRCTANNLPSSSSPSANTSAQTPGLRD